MTCFYHHWSYDTLGQCVAIPGGGGLRQPNVGRESVSLSSVRVESICGLVFACLEPDVPPLREYLGAETLALLESPFGEADLEVFHFHRSEIAANWKLFVETNCEGYHEFLHVLNPYYRRRSGKLSTASVALFRGRTCHAGRSDDSVTIGWISIRARPARCRVCTQRPRRR